jgi:hypothetical protein
VSVRWDILPTDDGPIVMLCGSLPQPNGHLTIPLDRLEAVHQWLAGIYETTRFPAPNAEGDIVFPPLGRDYTLGISVLPDGSRRAYVSLVDLARLEACAVPMDECPAIMDAVEAAVQAARQGGLLARPVVH